MYSLPIVRLPMNKTKQLPIEWDAPSSSITVKLPEDSYPLVLVFGLSSKVPKSRRDLLSLLFPWLKFKQASEDIDSGSSSSEDEKKQKKPTKVILPISLVK